jgi:hypothetical protein
MDYAAYIILRGRMSDNKGGRPSNKELASTGEMTKREQAAAMKTYRQRLLLHPSSPKLIEKLFSTALDDESKNQAVAMKLLADRLLPVAGFTTDGKANNAVSINISGIGGNGDTPGVTISGSSGEVEDE